MGVAAEVKHHRITLSCMINSTALAMEAQNEENLSEPDLTDTSDPIDSLLNTTAAPPTCGQLKGGSVVDYGGSYVWSVETQGYIVGATFFGGMLSVFPSGLAIDHFSMRHLLLGSVLLLSTASMLVPIFADTIGPAAVVILRFLMGVGEGIMIPGINGMISRWIPLHEKSTAAALYTSGNQLAGIIVNPVSAGFCESTFRWPGVIPWGAMARSKPLIVVFYSGIVVNMMIAMILVYIPVYFKDVLMLDVKTNGLYTALAHVCNLASKLVWGFLMDYLKRKKLLTPTQAVKLSQAVSMVTLSTCFFLLAYGVDCSTHLRAVVLLCTIGAGFGLAISGFLTSLLSISPNFIGVLSSTSQIIGFGGRMAAPQIITYFKTIGTAEEWRGILLVYSGLTILSAVTFLIWGSGDVQPWDTYKLHQKEAKNEKPDSRPLVDENALQSL
ncbi:unnamed protein product [Nippostrongylus brasiliensis]|uniref:MFS domain-containing protein n=1 Tax=Nippostrongylus brasiliensis TaxID=27835 RepID=A0A158QXB6_NIPBR|nr:unnamed protein product [Nippostrongylus brasiliensis]